MKIIKYISVLLCLALTFTMLSACQAKPTESGAKEDNRVIITAIKKPVPYAISVNSSVGGQEKIPIISDELKTLMEKYDGQDVWFRVFFTFSSTSENKDTVKRQRFDYVSSMGAKNVSEKRSSDYPRSYTMEVTADMINQISESGYISSLDIAHPARVDGFNEKISDTLTDFISKMGDTDTLEIAAVMVYDKMNCYATIQDIGAYWFYGTYIKFYQGLGIIFAECDALLEQTVVDILKRNNILEKRVVSDDLPEIGFGEVLYPHAESLEDIPVGFNAVLTKAEILKLAEDEEIKVIYLAPQK